MQRSTAEKWKKWLSGHRFTVSVLLFACFFLFALFVNRKIKIGSLYMDDLANYWYSLRMSFWQYAFGTVPGQTYYRPVFFGVLYLICRFITGHLERIALVNSLLLAANGAAVFVFLKKLAVNNAVSFLITLLCLFSHLSYFIAGQMIAPVEALSQFFSLWILMKELDYLYRDAADPLRQKKDTVWILLLYVLAVFTHERYIGLLVPALLTFFLGKTERRVTGRRVFLLVLVFAGVMAIRFAALRKLIPAGTSKSDVAESFQLGEAVLFAIRQAGFVLGICTGPEYLTGKAFPDSALWVKAFSLLGAALMLGMILCYFIQKLKPRKTGEDIYGTDWRIDALFLTSVMMYIASSSVTIRLEMRWIYVSFTVCMIYGGYMVTALGRRRKKGKKVLWAAFLLLLLLRGACEYYYRGYYDNIFFFRSMKATNSLAEETVGKYSREELKQKTFYLVTNTYDLSGKFWYNFYEPFFGEADDSGIARIDTVEYQTDLLAAERYPDREASKEEYERLREEMTRELLRREDAVLLLEDTENGTYTVMER